MELQRSRRTLGLGIAVLVGGVLGLICAWGAVDTLSTVFYAGFAVLALTVGTVLIRDELKPFRFTITPEGLTLRSGPLPWSGIDRIVLDEPPPTNSRGPGPHLLLIPTGGTPSDARVILQLDDVKQSATEIATALTEHTRRPTSMIEVPRFRTPTVDGSREPNPATVRAVGRRPVAMAGKGLRGSAGRPRLPGRPARAVWCPAATARRSGSGCRRCRRRRRW
jgi:hypothetical protein